MVRGCTCRDVLVCFTEIEIVLSFLKSCNWSWICRWEFHVFKLVQECSGWHAIINSYIILIICSGVTRNVVCIDCALASNNRQIISIIVILRVIVQFTGISSIIRVIIVVSLYYWIARVVISVQHIVIKVPCWNINTFLFDQWKMIAELLIRSDYVCLGIDWADWFFIVSKVKVLSVIRQWKLNWLVSL